MRFVDMLPHGPGDSVFPFFHRAGDPNFNRFKPGGRAKPHESGPPIVFQRKIPPPSLFVQPAHRRGKRLTNPPMSWLSFLSFLPAVHSAARSAHPLACNLDFLHSLRHYLEVWQTPPRQPDLPPNLEKRMNKRLRSRPLVQFRSMAPPRTPDQSFCPSTPRNHVLPDTE